MSYTRVMFEAETSKTYTSNGRFLYTSNGKFLRQHPRTSTTPWTVAGRLMQKKVQEGEQMKLPLDDLDAPFEGMRNWHTYKTMVIAHQRFRVKFYDEVRFGTLAKFEEMARESIIDSATGNRWMTPSEDWVSVDLEKVDFQGMWDLVLDRLQNENYDCEKLARPDNPFHLPRAETISEHYLDHIGSRNVVVEGLYDPQNPAYYDEKTPKSS